MSFIATVLNVMIASPGDVTAERGLIRDVIAEWNATHAEHNRAVLLPIGWDTHASPMMGDRGQAIINKQVLDKGDLLVACLWTRLGSPTGAAPSGTVEEIEKHIASGKPAMLYFSNAPLRPDSVDEIQYKALLEFRESCKERGLIETYDSIDDFRQKFTRQLAQTVMREFPIVVRSNPDGTVVNGFRPIGPSEDALTLLKGSMRDGSGYVSIITTFGGINVTAGGVDWGGRDVRSAAKWRAALRELISLGLVEQTAFDQQAEGYQANNAGFQFFDKLAEGNH